MQMPLANDNVFLWQPIYQYCHNVAVIGSLVILLFKVLFVEGCI